MSTWVVGLFFTPRDSSSLNFSPMCDSSTSQMAATSTFGIRDHAFTWLEPRPPSPITATRTRSFGLCARPLIAALLAITAVLIRKYRRFMAVPS